MKSASSVLENIAPPPVGIANDLGTVREEEEEEEEPLEEDSHGSSKQAERRTSNATATTTSSSPSSSYDEGEESRFSSSASTTSSISSLDSRETPYSSDESLGTVKSAKDLVRKPREDKTPLASPILPSSSASQATPTGLDAGSASGSVWGQDGFEGPATRERREKLEKKRMESMQASSPYLKQLSSYSVMGNGNAEARPAHGRRKSTAFELGGSWGSMMGKKWNDLANSET